MITKVTEKRLLNYKEAKAEYDGHLLLFDQRDFPPEDDIGYVVAYGDETDEDRAALRHMNHSEYNGEMLLTQGWKQKDDILYCGFIRV